MGNEKKINEEPLFQPAVLTDGTFGIVLNTGTEAYSEGDQSDTGDDPET